MKPILFNTEMVKAILDSRKTVTRRLMKTIPIEQSDCSHKEFFNLTGGTNEFACSKCGYGVQPSGHSVFKSPYQDGDILYVRETFADTWTPEDDTGYVYKADGQPNSFPYWGNASTFKDEVWRPSLHMPKEAARLFLRVNNVRVEKLQDMPHDAPMQEGIRSYTKDGELYKFAVSDDWWLEYHKKHHKNFTGTFWQDMPRNPTIAFSYLWNSTIKKYDYGSFWQNNPWVWVIEFERISKEEAYGN